MSLHGEIKVNGLVIGTWEAVRQGEIQRQPGVARVIDPNTTFDYACTANLNSSPDGCPAVLERFTVTHRFGDGALVLASKVLMHAAAMAEAKR